MVTNATTDGSMQHVAQLEGNGMNAEPGHDVNAATTVVDGNGGYTLDQAFVHLGFGRAQAVMFVFVGIAWIGDGMEMMLLSFLGPEIKCDWGITAAQESWITSVVFIGMMFGSYTWGAVSDAYGRRVGFFATAAFTSLFGGLSAAAPSYGFLLLARGLVGFGLGGVHVAYTLFMEFLPVENRGRWLCLIEFCWTLGSLSQAGLAWLVLPSRFGWRGLVLFSALPLVLLLVLYPFIRESPHWLLANGHRSKAEQVLEWVAKVNGKPMLPGRLLHSSTHSIRNSLDDDTADIQAPVPGGIGQLITSGLKSMGDSLGVMFGRSLRMTSIMLQVIWCMVALSYYGLIILAVQIHADTNDECTDSGRAVISNSDFRDIFVTTVGEVTGLAVCVAAVDTIGRKKTLFGSLNMVVLFLTPLLAGLRPDIIFLVLTRMFVYSAFITLYIYSPEVYPTSIRSFAFGVANAFSRVGGLIAPFIAVDLLEKVGVSASVGVLLAACAIAAILAILLPIETMGRSLPETIEELELQNMDAQRTTGTGSNQFQSISEIDASADSPLTMTKNPFFEVQLGASGDASTPGMAN